MIRRWKRKVEGYLAGHDLIFTVRGLLLLILVLYFLTGPVLSEADVIATILCFSLLTIICAIIVLLILYRYSLGSKLAISIFSPAGSEESNDDQFAVRSGDTANYIIQISPFSLLPLFELHLQLKFHDSDFTRPIHKLVGLSGEQRVVSEEIVFPHRGIWAPSTVEVTLCDQLGFGKFKWEVTPNIAEQNFRVLPPEVEESMLPVLSSCVKPGDILPDVNNRVGDPLDLKAYHPSDGVKRILWKLYAKSGELISRHPEPSMAPEGQVVVFCLAGLGDDKIAGRAVGYLKRLEDLELDVLFGCEGMGIRNIATDTLDAEKLVADCAWATAETTLSSLTTEVNEFLGQVRQEIGGGEITQALLFCSGSRLVQPGVKDLFINAGNVLENQHISPIYCVQGDTDYTATTQEKGNLKSFVRKVFVEEPLQPSAASSDPSAYLDFMNHCSNRDWQVIV